MKLVYIAGPYRGQTISDVHDNIQRARSAAISVLKTRSDWFPITPHMNTAFLDGVCDDRVFLDGDIELMLRCDAVLMLPRWKESEGAKNEHQTAQENGIEIFYGIEEIKEGK